MIQLKLRRVKGLIGSKAKSVLLKKVLYNKNFLFYNNHISPDKKGLHKRVILSSSMAEQPAVNR